MLYSFLDSFFPYALLCSAIGFVLLIILGYCLTEFPPVLKKEETIFTLIFVLAEILYGIGTICGIAILPLGFGSLCSIEIDWIVSIILLPILLTGICHKRFIKEDFFKTCISQIILYLVSTLILSVLLYKDFKVIEVNENTTVSQETRTIVSFNDIPLENVSDSMQFESGISEYITYGYIDKYGNVLHDKVLSYDSTKRSQEDGNYHVTITTYETITKLSTIHETFDGKYSKHTVAIFYLPSELVETK